MSRAIDEYIEQVLHRRNREIAASLLSDGMAVEAVAKHTGLTPEEVTALAECRDILDCYANGDLFSGIMAGLEQALAHARGEEVPGILIRERSTPDQKLAVDE